MAGTSARPSCACASYCPTLCGDANRGARVRGLIWGCTHKIADSDLINVRFGPLCGLKPDISRVREVPGSDICSAAKLQRIRSPRRRLKTSFALLVTLPTPISLCPGGGANVAAARTGNEVER